MPSGPCRWSRTARWPTARRTRDRARIRRAASAEGRRGSAAPLGRERLMRGWKMAEVQFRETAAAGYDRAVGHMTRQLIPPLLRAAHLQAGMRVLDIATGTGIAAEAAAQAVGATGHVVAADISPAMVERARDRLGGLSNVSFA